MQIIHVAKNVRMEKNDIDLPELLINKAKEMSIIEIKTNLKINQP